MSKQRVLTSILMPICFLFACLFFSACNDVGVKEINIEQYQQEIQVGGQYNYDNIVVKATKSDDSIAVVEHNENLTFSAIDTQTVGEKNLIATFKVGDKKFTSTKSVLVYSTIQSISIKSGIADTIYVGQTLNISNMVLTVNYGDDLSRNFNYAYIANDATFSYENISTQTAGEKTLTINYKGKTVTKVINVLENYTALGLSQSESYTNYLQNSQKQNTYTATGSEGVKGFAVIGNPYLVGYDNDFTYSPILQVVMNGTTPAYLLNFSADIKVFKVLDNDEEELDLDDNEYVSVTDEYAHKFQFTAQANGQTFRIEIFPSNATISPTIAPVSATVKVVKGYNVYTAKDLAVIDNVNAGGKWTALKQEYGLTNVVTDAIILHNDITIKAEDVPSVHFWTAAEVVGASDADRVIGSLKDEDVGYDSTYEDAGTAELTSGQVLGNIYRRMLRSGESFTIEGNYFTLSAHDIPLIVRESGDSVSQEGEAIVTHTSLLGVEYENMTELGNNAQFNLNNISLFGNANKDDDYIRSGGVMFVKTRNVATNINNNLSQSWYMSYMFRGPKPSEVPYYTYDELAEEWVTAEEDIMLVNIKDTNVFDAYNCLLYIQGLGNIKIDSCIMIGAGGPVMIIDHAKDRNSDVHTGRPVNVITVNSILESYIAGTEGWFESMPGSGALVSQFKSLDAVIGGFTAAAKQYSLPGSEIKTIVKGDKLNLIVVFKSDNTAGVEDVATFSTFTDLDAGFTNGLQMSRYSALVSGGANVIETFNGGWCVPTDTEPYVYAYGDGTGMYNNPADMEHFGSFLQKLASAQKYLSGYLYNQMGVLVGYMDNTNQ